MIQKKFQILIFQYINTNLLSEQKKLLNLIGLDLLEHGLNILEQQMTEAVAPLKKLTMHGLIWLKKDIINITSN